MAILLELHDEVLYLKGHDVRDWMDRTTRNIESSISRAAPLNERPNKGPNAPPVGTLKASIYGNVDHVGARVFNVTVGSTAPYAIYVLRGTQDKIVMGNPWMWLPDNPGFHHPGAKVHHIVGGQRAQPFIRDGIEFAVRSYGHTSLAGWNPV